MKVIIAGSREGFEIGEVFQSVQNSGWAKEITEIVSGGERGVDRLGESFARANGIPIKQFIPDWDGPAGKGAGYVRNEEMAKYADALIVLIYNNSRGSEHMLRMAKKYGLKTYVYRNEV